MKYVPWIPELSAANRAYISQDSLSHSFFSVMDNLITIRYNDLVVIIIFK